MMHGKRFDLTGQRFGRLTVIERGENTRHNKMTWLCLCECGNTKHVIAGDLKSGRTNSCGCLRKEATAKRLTEDLIGQRFGRLVVIGLSDTRVKDSVTWFCKCDCGKFRDIPASYLKTAHIESCGCLRSEVNRDRAIKRNTTHGLTHTKGYITAMSSARRAAKLQRTPKWADLDAIADFYVSRPEGYHVDHIIPLQGEKVSGLHVLENLQYLPAVENVRKHNKFEPFIRMNNHS